MILREARIAGPFLLLISGACNPFESQFIAACESALKKTLRSPSTYERVEVTEASEALSLEKYLFDMGESEAVRDVYRRSGTKPVRVLAYFEFDADNAYGTPIRSFAECSYDTSDGDASRASEHIVKIDGKTASRRLLDAVRAQ